MTRNELILSHLWLCDVIAKKMIAKLPASIELDDLVQEGMLGLIDAAAKFDPTRDNLFKTYAEYRILGAIKDHLREQDFVSRSERQRLTETGEAGPQFVEMEAIRGKSVPPMQLDSMLQSEINLDLAHKVSRLRPSQRQAVLGTFYVDQSQKSFAERESVTESAICARLKLAIKHLKRQFKWRPL